MQFPHLFYSGIHVIFLQGDKTCCWNRSLSLKISEKDQQSSHNFLNVCHLPWCFRLCFYQPIFCFLILWYSTVTLLNISKYEKGGVTVPLQQPLSIKYISGPLSSFHSYWQFLGFNACVVTKLSYLHGKGFAHC